MKADELARFEWKPTTGERYWEMLEALPPACMFGFGFLVGEPMDHATCKVTGRGKFWTTAA